MKKVKGWYIEIIDDPNADNFKKGDIFPIINLYKENLKEYQENLKGINIRSKIVPCYIVLNDKSLKGVK